MLSRFATRLLRPVPVLARTLATKLGPGGLELKASVEKKIAAQKKKIAAFRQKHDSDILDKVTVKQAYGGMRGIKSMITETSLLDAEEGIRFRGYSIPECQQLLPKAKGAEQPLPEGILWLLLTGDVPSEAQVQRLTEQLHQLAPLPPHVIPLIDSLPKTMHPMTQFSAAVLALQTESAFAEGYREGMPKSDYFDKTYEDVLTLLARLPEVAARIYCNCFKGGKMQAYDKTVDWSANFSQMMGFTKPLFFDMMRMYLTIHSDHEGGNVSAHTTHLVGSALSDAYLSLSAGLNGLAGPLHGLANQEVLRFLREVIGKVGPAPSQEELKKMVAGLIAGKKVVPGYGHAVLRKTDPRYVCQREFCLKHLPDDPMFKIVSDLYKVTPPILGSVAKIANPWPNVDAHSGVLLQHFGLIEEDFYTVLFGVSRAIGVLAQLVWARGLGFPIERPKSLTTELCMKAVGAKQFSPAQCL